MKRQTKRLRERGSENGRWGDREKKVVEPKRTQAIIQFSVLTVSCSVSFSAFVILFCVRVPNTRPVPFRSSVCVCTVRVSNFLCNCIHRRDTLDAKRWTYGNVICVWHFSVSFNDTDLPTLEMMRIVQHRRQLHVLMRACVHFSKWLLFLFIYNSTRSLQCTILQLISIGFYFVSLFFYLLLLCIRLAANCSVRFECIRFNKAREKNS